MPSKTLSASLRWEGGVPVSTLFDDPYYSRADGLAESRHVFLEGNNLSKRFADAEAFHIAELGFGTGLNFLASYCLWRGSAAQGAVLQYTAFELAPLSSSEMANALDMWPELSGATEMLLAGWPTSDVSLPGARLHVILGDARRTLPTWAGVADAWFLDGFAPARNPEMWEPGLLASVFEHTRPGGSAATYSAAGAVRRALTGSGFLVAKTPGFGRKRDMTVAVRPSP